MAVKVWWVGYGSDGHDTAVEVWSGAVLVWLGPARYGTAVKVWCVRTRSGWARIGGQG